MIMFRTVGRPLVDKNLVLEKLRDVLDPEIGRSIVDLNMVRDITVSDGNVYVKIALTVAHCPLAKTLQADVEAAVRKLEAVTSVKVETTTMSRKELEELKLQLQAGAGQSTRSKSGPVGPGIERLGKRGVRSIIAVISGKGGVGKSFVTSMLASELKRRGYEVGVLDADLTGPSIAKVLGVSGKPYKGPGGGIVPLMTKTGIKVMSINLILEDPNMPVVWRGPIVNSVIRQLYWDVDWGDLHYLLVRRRRSRLLSTGPCFNDRFESRKHGQKDGGPNTRSRREHELSQMPKLWREGQPIWRTKRRKIGT